MGLKRHSILAILPPILAFACAKQPAAPVVAPAPGSAPLKVEPAPDLSPVAAPKDLVLVARAERLENAVSTVAQWMNLPFDIHMLDQLGPGLSQTVRADMPVEAAVALAEGGDTDFAQPYAVFSIGVTSLEAGRQMFEKFERKMEQTAPGVWMTVDESAMTCAVAASVGRAAARAICGGRKIDVQTLLPYATRGLPLQDMGTADAHIELRLAPLRERYGSKLRQGKALAVPMILHEIGISDARLSRPVTDILYAFGDEVVDVIDDVDRILIDSRLAQSPDRVDISTTFDFARARSWTAQAVADAGKRAGPAPGVFFELPADSKMATYMSAQNPKMYEGIVHRTTSLLDGLLAHLDVNAKARDELSRSLDQINATRYSAAACGGVPSETAFDAETGKFDLLASYGPWYVCVYDQQPLASFTGALDATSKVLSDPAFRKVLDAKMVSLKRHAAPAGMPAGTVAYELALDSEGLTAAVAKLVTGSSAPKSTKNDQKKAGKGSATKLQIYLVPDGTRTLLGLGTQSSELQTHLQALKKAPPESRTGANVDLAWLRQTSTVAGGYFTIASLMKVVEKGVAASKARLGRKEPNRPVPDALSAAPHHGQTPIPISWSVKGDPTAPKLEGTLRLTRAVFEDAFAVGTQYAVQLAR